MVRTDGEWASPEPAEHSSRAGKGAGVIGDETGATW
jgi:hypothetical protein